MKSAAAGALALFKRLSAIHRKFSGTLDFKEALGLISGGGLELVGADACLILLRQGQEGLRVGASRGVDPDTAGRFIGTMEESVIQELRLHFGCPASQAVSAAPIMADLIVQGILVVFRGTPLEEHESALLSTLADQAAITLKNAHLHESLRVRETRLRDELDRFRTLAGELEAWIEANALDPQGPAPAARVRDVLTYSRLTRTEASLEPVDVEAAVLEALARIKTEIKSRAALVRLESPAFTVLAERSILVGILEKLFTHALVSVDPAGQPRVELRAELRGSLVRVSVTHQRRERDAADLEKGGELPGGLQGGMQGIGLAIVRRGVERLGGHCGVEAKSDTERRLWIDLREA